MNALDLLPNITDLLGEPTDLAHVLVANALIDDRPAPGWSEVRAALSTDRGLSVEDADQLILDGLRAGDARASLSDGETWPEWHLRVRSTAARVVLLRYAAGQLDKAGFTIETAHDYEGSDQLLVLTMTVELDKFARGEVPPPRPATYRRFLDG